MLHLFQDYNSKSGVSDVDETAGQHQEFQVHDAWDERGYYPESDNSTHRQISGTNSDGNNATSASINHNEGDASLAAEVMERLNLASINEYNGFANGTSAESAIDVVGSITAAVATGAAAGAGSIAASGTASGAAGAGSIAACGTASGAAGAGSIAACGTASGATGAASGVSHSKSRVVRGSSGLVASAARQGQLNPRHGIIQVQEVQKVVEHYSDYATNRHLFQQKQHTTKSHQKAPPAPPPPSIDSVSVLADAFKEIGNKNKRPRTDTAAVVSHSYPPAPDYEFLKLMYSEVWREPYMRIDRSLYSVYDAFMNGCTVACICSSTGDGKSTRIPMMLQHLFKDKCGVVLCLQPTRSAVMNLYHFMRKIYGDNCVALGIRGNFNIVYGMHKIAYCTYGMANFMAVKDPYFLNVPAIMMDEVHLANSDQEVTFGLVARAMRHNKKLRTVCSSATADFTHFRRHFTSRNQNARVEVFDPSLDEQVLPPPIYKRNVVYKPVPEDTSAMEHTANQVEAYVRDNVDRPDRGVMVFMAGVPEICCLFKILVNRHLNETCELLKYHRNSSEISKSTVLRTHFEGDPRRIILCTNYAETGLTVTGVSCVIDTMVEKCPTFDSAKGLAGLRVEHISKASADQRAGRTGRVSDGLVIRLCTEWQYDNLVDFPISAMLSENLESTLLNTLLVLQDLRAVVEFQWLHPPEASVVVSAVGRLRRKGALRDCDGRAIFPSGRWCPNATLTEKGQDLASFHIDPVLADLVYDAISFGVGVEMCMLVAMMSFGSDCWTHGVIGGGNEQFWREEGDHITTLVTMLDFINAMHGEQDMGVNWCIQSGLNHLLMLEALLIFQKLYRKMSFTFPDDLHWNVNELCLARGVWQSNIPQVVEYLREKLKANFCERDHLDIYHCRNDNKSVTLAHSSVVRLFQYNKLFNNQNFPKYICYTSLFETVNGDCKSRLWANYILITGCDISKK